MGSSAHFALRKVFYHFESRAVQTKGIWKCRWLRNAVVEQEFRRRSRALDGPVDESYFLTLARAGYELTEEE